MSRFESINPNNEPLRVNGQTSHIALREITLRQLGHMEADMTFDEKLYLLAQLDRIGVAEAQVWGIDADAADLVVQARDRGIGLGIVFFGKPYFLDELRGDIRKARDCGAAMVCVNGRGPDRFLEYTGWTRQRMIDACVAAVKEAKDYGVAISVGLAYSAQSNLGFLEEFSGAIEAAGADRLYVPDSMGVASPHTMHRMVAALREVVRIPIEVHCHDDFGLAVANTLASIEAGATVVEVHVNGTDPERCGIASLDEVVMALELLYGVDTGIKTEELTELSRLHEQMTGMNMPTTKPLVGPRAFNYRVASGEAASEPQRDHFYGSPMVLPFDPAIVGNRRTFLLGKYSGSNEVTQQLSSLGITVTPAQMESVVALVQERGVATKEPVSDDDLRYFVEVAQVARPDGNGR
ncbi:MAG: hypothetical protein HY329_02580 [Chloroflexi bacterium]|nr:hypothetical protein [Chloroflexota bacterium]